jgi:hypothetical protein
VTSGLSALSRGKKARNAGKGSFRLEVFEEVGIPRGAPIASKNRPANDPVLRFRVTHSRVKVAR